MSSDSARSRHIVVLFTDLVDSVKLKTQLGTPTYTRMLGRHNQIFDEVVSSIPHGQIVSNTGDGFMAMFDTSSDAVNAALMFQHRIQTEPWDPQPLNVRIGINQGQVTQLMGGDADTVQPVFVGRPIDLASRLTDLAGGGQILLTRAAFDDARQYVKDHPCMTNGERIDISWQTHGRYSFKGTEGESLEICEVGAVDYAPFTRPEDGVKGKRELTLVGGVPGGGATGLSADESNGGFGMDLTLDDDPQHRGIAEEDDATLQMGAQPLVGAAELSPLPQVNPDETDPNPPSASQAASVSRPQTVVTKDAAVDDLIGTTLGDFTILALIGQGGMGKVYRAQHNHLQKEYAVKVLQSRLMGAKGFADRLKHEAQVMAELDHPNIVRVHHMSEQDGVYYLVMEYVTGLEGKPKGMDRCLAGKGSARPGVSEAQKWAGQIAEALDYAHKNGVVHLDLKPANILIDHAGNAKLVDFGLAKVVGAEVTGIRGTPSFMPPEQRGKGGVLDERTDIYSYGVLLNRVVTSIEANPQVPKDQVEALRRQWSPVIGRCREDEQAKRYQSFCELIPDLTPAGPVTRFFQSIFYCKWGHQRLRIATLATAAVLVLALGTWGVVSFIGGNGEDDPSGGGGHGGNGQANVGGNGGAANGGGTNGGAGGVADVGVGHEIGFKFDTAGGRRRFVGGEFLHFAASAQRDCFLLFFTEDEQGVTLLIVPNERDGDIRLRAGEERMIPPLKPLVAYHKSLSEDEGVDSRNYKDFLYPLPIPIGAPTSTDKFFAVALRDPYEIDNLQDEPLLHNASGEEGYSRILSKGMATKILIARNDEPVRSITLSELIEQTETPSDLGESRVLSLSINPKANPDP